MAIQAKPLTNTEVEAAKAPNKDLSLYGGGLLLFVKSSGVKTWRLRYYHPTTKKQTTLTPGHYPTLSLVEARKGFAPDVIEAALVHVGYTPNP
ncbi:integrase arm-type DNA-binding domain-containing protein [Candidatus Fukatsuia symbiotica]|nr:integrase arm-type DNA-binding domain-containing protein [Candidatus Fukatsuia symbiotica]MEA9446137.1 integrase arm-type DNA-binding domain-containing protein [Candidatus Fukatsuia symbiotica]